MKIVKTTFCRDGDLWEYGEMLREQGFRILRKDVKWNKDDTAWTSVVVEYGGYGKCVNIDEFEECALKRALGGDAYYTLSSERD